MPNLRKMVLIAALVALGCLLAGSVGCTTKPDPERFSRTVPHQHVPTWSPDGSLIKIGAMVVSVDGSHIDMLGDEWPADEYVRDRSVDLTPDGSRIVYTTFKHRRKFFWSREYLSSLKLEIASSALDGSERRRLTKNKYRDGEPVWSPDGSRIAFTSGGTDELGDWYTLHTMKTDGSDVLELAPSLRVDAAPPAWSPDGRMLAFTVLEETGFPGSLDYRGRVPAVYTIGSDGHGPKRLGQSRSQPVWSPDGSRVAFAGLENDEVSIYTMDPDGADVSKLISLGPKDLYLGWGGTNWGPDGWIGNLSWSSDGSELMWGANPVSVMNADGSNVRQIVKFPKDRRREHYSSWSPDGSRIAIHSPQSPIVLFTMGRDGTDRQVLARVAHGRLVAEYSDWRDVSKDIAACSEGQVVPNPKSNPDLVSDCETLLRIRDTLAGETGQLNWSQAYPITEWRGITVAGSPPRVEALKLRWVRDWTLDGSIPPEIGDLIGLKELLLEGHAFTGGIPAELGNLTLLETLQLSQLSLAGSIPPELGNLVNLRGLFLTHNVLTGTIPPELGNLSNLEAAGLDGNKFSGCFPGALVNIPGLGRFRHEMPLC